MFVLQGVSYMHPNKDLLFSDIDLVINKQSKVALIGNNGAGKSTLLKILAGNIRHSSGMVRAGSKPYYIPQIAGQLNDLTIAAALGIAGKVSALKDILAGNVTEANITMLADDWAIEERCREAFAYWRLGDLALDRKMDSLSGGQKVKVLLAGILVHNPEIVLLDEPSNHLDAASRGIMYDYIQTANSTLVVVSHDRTLLNLLDTVYELSRDGIAAYGGNYDFYLEQKKVERNALYDDVKSKEKALRKAREVERESVQRQQKLDARGKKKQEKAGLPTISMNTLRNNAEKSTVRIKDVHAGKVDTISQDLYQLRKALPDTDKMSMYFDNSLLHKGKILVTAKGINWQYNGIALWKQGLDFQLLSGERIAIKGLNGSGKTTLIKLMLGQLPPCEGSIDSVEVNAIYIDQDYALVDSDHSLYEQAQQYNDGALQEHEIKIRLDRFLFTKDYWGKSCRTLSGGERMRLMLCCLTISKHAPDIIVLDEPTNNLDIQNVEILTTAIDEYKGTLIVVSHDRYFLEQIHISRSIDLV